MHWHDQGALPARFWQKVDRTGDCWEWTGTTTSGGYGHVSVNGKMVQAHRFAWAQRYGKIPEGRLICHHCDNRLCVRLTHLFEGSYKDNMEDCHIKGRAAIGASNANAIFSERDIYEIRRRHQQGVSQSQIARELHCHQSTISDIVRRKRWTHLL